ncbi:hypothetical protein AB0L40_04250 [Patulibacter sp. NPDC049589]|uniref:hypothetical protein n=1 Tax=Patulibacter sp. NPDC049589 TaxID=3154731 RepID=UPI0034123EA8
MGFDGDSVITVHDPRAVLLSVTETGLLAGFRRDYADTFDPEAPDDWEHVFTILPSPLLVPVTGATMITRTPRGSTQRPVQLSVLSLDALPDAPTSPTDFYADAYRALGPTRLLPLANVTREITDGAIADPETLALLFWILHAEHA